MAKDPAFLFYPNDYIGGTMGMTFEEKGAYIELLMLQFNRGHMTKHMIGQSIGQLWVNIEDKFIKDSKGLYYNKRLEDEQNKRKTYSESRKNNKLGKNQYTKVEKPRGHMIAHMEDEDINEDLNKNEDEKVIEIPYGLAFLSNWNIWKEYKKDQFGFVYKSHISEQAALKKLTNITPDEKQAIQIVCQSIENGWKGLFKLTNEQNGRDNIDKVQKYIDIISEQGN